MDSKLGELAKLTVSLMSWKLYCKFDELAKLECKFDELESCRMSSMSWISWTVSWKLDKLRISSMSWISCTVSWMSWLSCT